ncbi:MAG: PRC-barrel domain-containing protein [Acetivibrionales bacterium]
MLHRYSEVLNLPVICGGSGKKAGSVTDVVFSPGSREVKAFLLDDMGISLKKRAVFLGDVTKLGKDAVIIGSMNCISSIGRTAFAKAFGKSGLLGLKVFSKAGGEIGVVKDVLFDVQTGRIEGFEISDGFFQDVMQGRKILPLIGRAELGGEFAVVEKEAVDEMKETGGGIMKRVLK